MRPKVGRSPARPQRADGLRMDPLVSVPIAKPTQPAAVADDGPADDPLEPCDRFHGFFVCPPNHWSPLASSPVVSFAISTAPASRSISTMLASYSNICSLKAGDPHVVLKPFTEMMSLAPHGMPCSGPLYLPAAISASACFACARPTVSRKVTTLLRVAL